MPDPNDPTPFHNPDRRSDRPDPANVPGAIPVIPGGGTTGQTPDLPVGHPRHPGGAPRDPDWTRTGSSQPPLLDRLAADVGGTIDSVGRLPDGSGFATMSMPLPADHWLTADHPNVPPMPWRCGAGLPRRRDLERDLRAAGRYAVRCATMNGKDHDFDPDALIQCLIVGALGYSTPDGLSSDAWANPPSPPYGFGAFHSPWMNDARQVAGQCWGDPETSDRVLDPVLADAVARRIAVWMDTAACYRDLLDQCAASLGPEVYRSDDGSMQDRPIRLKIPGLVAQLAVRATAGPRAATPFARAVQAEIMESGRRAARADDADLMRDAADASGSSLGSMASRPAFRPVSRGGLPPGADLSHKWWFVDGGVSYCLACDVRADQIGANAPSALLPCPNIAPQSGNRITDAVPVGAVGPIDLGTVEVSREILREWARTIRGTETASTALAVNRARLTRVWKELDWAATQPAEARPRTATGERTAAARSMADAEQAARQRAYVHRLMMRQTGGSTVDPIGGVVYGTVACDPRLIQRHEDIGPLLDREWAALKPMMIEDVRGARAATTEIQKSVKRRYEDLRRLEAQAIAQAARPPAPDRIPDAGPLGVNWDHARETDRIPPSRDDIARKLNAEKLGALGDIARKTDAEYLAREHDPARAAGGYPISSLSREEVLATLKQYVAIAARIGLTADDIRHALRGGIG
jgi:hypothetical protein